MNSFHYFSWPTGKAIKAKSRGFEEIELLQMSFWLLWTGQSYVYIELTIYKLQFKVLAS